MEDRIPTQRRLMCKQMGATVASNIVADAAMAVCVEVLCTLEAVTALADEWATLLSPLACATCFQHPDWLIAWWRICGRGAQLYVLVLRGIDRKLVGVMPLQRTILPSLPSLRACGARHVRHVGRGWPWQVRIVRWLGQGALTDTLGPVFAAGYERAGMRAALRYLAEHSCEWDVLALAATPDEPFREITSWVCALPRLATFVRRVGGCLSIQLPSDWQSYQRTLSKNLRSNLARYGNRLKREGYQASYSVLTAEEEIRQALPHLFRLHRLRARAEGMKRHSDYFATPASRTMLSEVAGVLSRRGKLALAQLCIDGQVVALQLLLFQGDTMSLSFSGWYPQWSRYSVMMLTTKGSIEYAMSRGVTTVDLASGAGSQAKRQWSNQQQTTRYVVVAGHSFAGRVCLWGLRGLKVLQWCFRSCAFSRSMATARESTPLRNPI
jgi:CelD/BcsL family acetyltransferase involved in cellulose biosynthesis